MRAHISVQKIGRRYTITVVLPDDGPMGVHEYTVVEGVAGEARAYILAMGMQKAFELAGYEAVIG